MMNNKGRAEESGTTSQARRLRRESKQWTSLAATDDPVTSPSEMRKKVEALKKAQESAERQLKKMEEEQAALKKAEKDRPALRKLGKKNPRSQSEGPGGRSSSAAPSKPVLTPNDASLKKAEELKQKLASLKKEQESGATSSTGPVTQSSPSNLKKSEEEFTEVQGRKKKALKKADLPVVMVDWHNTMEVKNKLSVQNQMALARLMVVAQVVFISWVGSYSREKLAMKQMQCLPEWALKKVKAIRTTFRKTGDGGKCHLACDEQCEAVFDDDPDICWECQEWGLDVFAIESRKQSGKHANFAVAVKAYLKKYHPGKLIQVPEGEALDLDEIQLPREE